MAKIQATRSSCTAPACKLLVAAALVLEAGCARLTDRHWPTCFQSHSQSHSQSSATASASPQESVAHETVRQPPDSASSAPSGPQPTIRGQGWVNNENSAGSDDYLRGPMTPSDASVEVARQTSQTASVANSPPPGYVTAQSAPAASATAAWQHQGERD